MRLIVIIFILSLFGICTISCSSPNEPHALRPGKFIVDSLSLLITSEYNSDAEEMRGRAYLDVWYRLEIRPGSIEAFTIDPIGMHPISVRSWFNRCLTEPTPIDELHHYVAEEWFWDDVTYFDSLEVKIDIAGTFWKNVPENDTCRVVEYGPFECATWVKVAVE